MADLRTHGSYWRILSVRIRLTLQARMNTAQINVTESLEINQHLLPFLYDYVFVIAFKIELKSVSAVSR